MGEHFLAPDNDPRAVQESYTKIDARIAVGNLPGRWEVALIGKNLTDEITKAFANDVLGIPARSLRT
jgi:iron complex outermembrane receptor protein